MTFPHHWTYGTVLVVIGMSIITDYPADFTWLWFKDVWAWLFVFAGAGLIFNDLHEHTHQKEAHTEDIGKLQSLVRRIRGK